MKAAMKTPNRGATLILLAAAALPLHAATQAAAKAAPESSGESRGLRCNGQAAAPGSLTASLVNPGAA